MSNEQATRVATRWTRKEGFGSPTKVWFIADKDGVTLYTYVGLGIRSTSVLKKDIDAAVALIRKKMNSGMFKELAPYGRVSLYDFESVHDSRSHDLKVYTVMSASFRPEDLPAIQEILTQYALPG